MTTVPNPAAAVDARGFTVKTIAQPRAVHYVAKGSHTEKMTCSFVYRPAKRLLYVETFEGTTGREQLQVALWMMDILKGGGQDLPWNQCEAPDVEPGCLRVRVGFRCADPLEQLQQAERERNDVDAQFHALVAGLQAPVDERIGVE
ncbi:hypothetical protein [Clavibacter zhangzhiyongii]|uniref:hypothetical protein n=1 Tax=Clavibacter zhangzhiyongii TaxID=2768071 RepID=UPI0039E19818